MMSIHDFDLRYGQVDCSVFGYDEFAIRESNGVFT